MAPLESASGAGPAGAADSVGRQHRGAKGTLGTAVSAEERVSRVKNLWGRRTRPEDRSIPTRPRVVVAVPSAPLAPEASCGLLADRDRETRLVVKEQRTDSHATGYWAPPRTSSRHPAFSLSAELCDDEEDEDGFLPPAMSGAASAGSGSRAGLVRIHRVQRPGAACLDRHGQGWEQGEGGRMGEGSAWEVGFNDVEARVPRELLDIRCLMNGGQMAGGEDRAAGAE